MNKLTQIMMIVAGALLFGMEPAWAYLDPGTGSLILQSLIAGIAGALVVARLYWAKLKSFLAAAFSRDRAPPTAGKAVNDASVTRETEQP